MIIGGGIKKQTACKMFEARLFCFQLEAVVF